MHYIKRLPEHSYYLFHYCKSCILVSQIIQYFSSTRQFHISHISSLIIMKPHIRLSQHHFLLVVWCFVLLFSEGFKVAAMAQDILGVHGQYSVASGELSNTNKNFPAFELTYGSRRYCHLWTLVSLGYAPLSAKTDTTTTYFKNEISLGVEARYFPWKPMDVPLYISGTARFSSIGSTDSVASRAGLGGALGVGYLLFYNSDCCGWFLDVHARYTTMNGFIKSELRPTLNNIGLGIGVHFAL